MGATTQRTLQDRMAGVRRFMHALGNTPEEWEPADLAEFRRLHVEWLHVQDQAVAGLRGSGFSDAEIAEALGTTRQAVSKRWPGGGRYVGAAGRFRTTSTHPGSDNQC